MFIKVVSCRLQSYGEKQETAIPKSDVLGMFYVATAIRND